MRYTIIVEVVAPSQGAAFEFVENMVDARMAAIAGGTFVEGHQPNTVHVKTADGTRSVMFGDGE